MKNPDEPKNEAALHVIVDVLTSEKFSEKTRLTVLRGFRQTLNKGVSTLESKIINDCDIESLFNAVSLADTEGSSTDDGFHTEYFTFLLNGMWNEDLHEKIRLELVRILKLRRINNLQAGDLWCVLERNYLVWPEVIEGVLPYSKQFIEEIVLNWVTKFIETGVSLDDLNVRFYAEVSIHNCDIFHMLTAILNEFVIMTDGNENVLQLVHYFTSLVSELCDENAKLILRLYPRNFSHIVPFLSISPKIFSEQSLIKRNWNFEAKVLKLLLSAFTKDQKSVLLLLTHYPEWMSEFTAYMENNRINRTGSL